MDEVRDSRRDATRVAQLIEMGRDREAAELAVAQRHPFHNAQTHSEGKLMEVLDQLDTLGPLLAAVVGGIREDQLDNPTPCAAFTVRGVLEHMIGGATAFAAAFRGDEAGEPDAHDVLASFGPALTGLAASMHSPGALDRTIDAPFGAVPGNTFARFVVLDGLVHGWDLATATGQPYDPPAELVAAAEEFARATVDPLRDGETFAAAVPAPPDAAPIERLAAFTGRRASIPA
ncbi:MAG TPA: TIGR03086 family metal-binding protein [Mycobacteriales bacterium]|nr:TIGR03086 family metal-binding protein [Mycobacteriales bacterium]